MEATPPEHRTQPLWQLFRELQSDGWKLDATQYSTAFRYACLTSARVCTCDHSIKLAPPKPNADLESVRARLAPLGLTSSFNLGSCDVYPTSTGKEGAARYLMRMWGVRASDCVFLCDDDNDLGTSLHHHHHDTHRCRAGGPCGEGVLPLGGHRQHGSGRGGQQQVYGQQGAQRVGGGGGCGGRAGTCEGAACTMMYPSTPVIVRCLVHVSGLRCVIGVTVPTHSS